MDRDPQRIHAWIQAVYEERRFHAPDQPTVAAAAGVSGGASATVGGGGEVRTHRFALMHIRTHSPAGARVPFLCTACPPCFSRALQAAGEVAVTPLSDVLGSDTPKLKVSGGVGVEAAGLERSVSAG